MSSLIKISLEVRMWCHTLPRSTLVFHLYTNLTLLRSFQLSPRHNVLKNPVCLSYPIARIQDQFLASNRKPLEPK